MGGLSEGMRTEAQRREWLHITTDPARTLRGRSLNSEDLVQPDPSLPFHLIYQRSFHSRHAGPQLQGSTQRALQAGTLILPSFLAVSPPQPDSLLQDHLRAN